MWARMLRTSGEGDRMIAQIADKLVFDPRGQVEAELVAPAARVAALDGKRLGILDNTKWNAGRLLRRTASLLGERHDFAAVNYYRKESFSKAADPALLTKIADESDIVLTAIGD